jgi:hypothetical protein
MRQVGIAAVATMIVSAALMAGAGGAWARKPDGWVLVAPRGQLNAGEEVTLSSSDTSLETSRGLVIGCPTSTISGTVESNSAASTSLSLTEASFGGGIGEECNLEVPPLPASEALNAVGLPWTLTFKGQFFTITGTNGELLELQFPTQPTTACVYSGHLVGDSPFSTELRTEPLEEKLTSGCKTRRRATLTSSWSMTSKGERVELLVAT